MTDTFEFTLDNPLTEEQWDMIADVDMEHTDSITFHTKHGKEVEFKKVRHAKWVYEGKLYYSDNNTHNTWSCSGCGNSEFALTIYCPNCGAMMEPERREE